MELNESTSGNGSAATRKDAVPNVELSHEELLLAATLVRDATKGRNMSYKNDAASIRSYLCYNHPAFSVALQICVWGNLLLAIFEKPAVPGIHIPYWLTFMDMISYTIWSNVSEDESNAIRWSRPLRPLFLINLPEGRQIRKAFRNIRRTLPDILFVLLLFLASIAIFALLVLKLMLLRDLHYPDGRSYFTNYWESFWDLYVLVTTANNPDVMMPAYDESKWFALFFILYIIINLYIFMNIVLAVIYNNYKHHLKNEVKSNVYMKRRFLSKAFNLIKEWSGGQYVVTENRWKQLMAVIDSKKAPEHVDLLLCVLDDQGTRSIRKQEFLRVGDLLNVELKEVRLDDRNVFDIAFPTIYQSKASKWLCCVILSKYFQWFFDALILINAFCIGFNINEAEWFFLAAFTVEILLRLYALGPFKYFTRYWNVFDFVIITLSLLFTIIDSALGSIDSRTRTLDVLLVLRILRLVRLIGSFERFRVVLTTIVNIGPSIATYGSIIFVIFYIYAIIGMEIFGGAVKYYGYTNLTQEQLFCGNAKLQGTEFYIKRYCNNNFNDILHSFVILFELMVVNQWHVLSEGFVLVTHTAARVYFITFHMACVVIILNIFTAFILEIFILEYTFSKSSLQATVENRIKDLGLGVGQKPKIRVKRRLDKQVLVENIEENGSMDMPDSSSPDSGKEKGFGLRFRMKEKGSKNVETLLQLMFEGEIDPTDDGAEFDELQEEQQHSSTFDGVI